MPNTRVDWRGMDVARQLERHAERALAIACEEIRGQMKINLSGPSPSKPGNYPGADTGNLSRTLYNERTAPMVRRVGTALAYGRYQEHGATILPKRVKFLPVPLNRASSRMLSRLGGASLRTKNLKLIHRGGKMFLVTTTPGGKISKAENAPRFILKKMVRIAPRPWCYRTALQTRGRFQARFKSEMMKAMGGVR